MAIVRKSVCDRCHSSEDAGPLFDTLERLAKKQVPPCKTCKAAQQIHLVLDFGPDAGKDSIALAAFLPRPPREWSDSKEREVTFCPFLVITAGAGRDRSVWMPYWHIAREGNKRTAKYGQWALYMDLASYVDLIEQATASGLLDRHHTRSG
jgi:hypothetical protein